MHNKQPLNIARAGGGSGGHVYPIRSLIMYMMTYSDHPVHHYRYGSAESMELRTFTELHKKNHISDTSYVLDFVLIWSGKMRREWSLHALILNMRDLFLFIWGICQAFFSLWKHRIDVVFCKGWFVALPVIVAARVLRIPIIAHESDTHPWLVNRIAYRCAQQMFCGFDNVFPRATVIGQILSDELLVYADMVQHNISKKQKADYHPVIDWTNIVQRRDTVVVVTGWSLGAKSLYDAVRQLIQQWVEGFTMIIVGWALNTDIMDQISTQDDRVVVVPSLSQVQMGEIYRHADVVITRAGTTSLAEQQLFGVQQIVVPLDVTHDQADNARRYHQHHSAIVIQDDSYLADHLSTSLRTLHWYKKSSVDIQPLRHQCQYAKNIIAQYILWFDVNY